MSNKIVIYAFLFMMSGLSFQSQAESALTLSGRYEYRLDGESVEMLGKRVCFYPDEQSANFVPRRHSKNNFVWFCFKNSKPALKMLGIPQNNKAGACGYAGTASVQVSHYQPYDGEGDGFDMAMLKAVISHSRAAGMVCR